MLLIARIVGKIGKSYWKEVGFEARVPADRYRWIVDGFVQLEGVMR